MDDKRYACRGFLTQEEFESWKAGGELGKPTEPIKLHLGCGKRKLPGWVGVDSRNDVGADVVADVRYLDHWASGEVAAIYACHVLEHIPRPHVLPTLRDWHRVLKPGGVLLVSVPDFEQMACLYVNQGISLWRLIGPLCGRQDYPENTHYSVYDYEYLAWMLAEAGFHTIRPWRPDIVLPQDYDDFSKALLDGCRVSLNLEATRA
jgi:predicted SAM-dependent methyltransferase